MTVSRLSISLFVQKRFFAKASYNQALTSSVNQVLANKSPYFIVENC